VGRKGKVEIGKEEEEGRTDGTKEKVGWKR